MKLPKVIIIEWMQMYLQDEKYLFKFCRSFSINENIPLYTQKLILPIIFQQLWLLHDKSPSNEFVIDQTLRRIMASNYLLDQIFKRRFPLNFQSIKVSAFAVHPLIMSVVIALHGGVYLNSDGTFKTNLSTKRMHRESSILKHLFYNEGLHSIKIRYENILQNCSPSDISIDIVDTFIALICLQGVSRPLIYRKYEGYRALSLAIKRLKQIWFYLITSFDSYSETSESSRMISELRSIICQTNLSNEQRISLLVVWRFAWKKGGVWNLPELLFFHGYNIHPYFQCQSKFIHFIINENLDEISQTTYSHKILLNFLPVSLQKLYSSTQHFNSLSFVVFLSQCLSDLENVIEDDFDCCLALLMLDRLLKEHHLENYALVLFREKYSDTKSFDDDHDEFIQTMKDQKLSHSFLIDQSKDYEMLIHVERQRICQMQNAEQLFAALISLARLFQAKHRSNKSELISLTFIENQEVLCAFRNLHDPILRILALSIISEMKDPLIFDEKGRDLLRNEMINQLKCLLTFLPLTTSTFLFVRCHTIRQFYSESFLHMAKIIGEKLNANKQSQEQEAAFIALRQLRNSDLSPYLSKFAKQTKNLSELLHFNSTVFYDYLTNTNSLNIVRLSSMYLAELSFDIQILQMYTEDDHTKNIRPLQVLKQLWDDASKKEKILTSKVAKWINNHLKILNIKDIDQIIQDVSRCSMIERNVLEIIEEWLDYRLNENLRFFAHYAAFQLLLEGSTNPDLIDIIDDAFRIDKIFRFKHLVERLFKSQLIDLITVRRILITLCRNIRYSSWICLYITRKDLLDLILDLELERITSNMYQTRSFLSTVKNCPEDLQDYLAEHLHLFLNIWNEIDHNIKDKYVAVVIERIIVISAIENNCSVKFYNLVFSLFNDQQLSEVQKAILNSLNFVFCLQHIKIGNIFMQDNTIINLEKMICSWNKYQEDTIAICLLTYGNILLKFQQLKIARNVSDEVNNILDHLFETSLSEIISIRAGYCRILAQYSHIDNNILMKWFNDKSYTTLEKRYRILLQQTLYRTDRLCIGSKNEHETEDIETISLALIDTFVIDLYNYLCHQNDNKDSTPNYVSIALKVSKTHLGKFRNAIEKSSFGEREFKTKLYHYCKNNPNESEISIELMMIFETLTVELVDMLTQIKHEIRLGSSDRNYLKQVANRDAIEQLFRVLNAKITDGNFRNFLNLLKSAIYTRDISLVEVHQMISLKSHWTNYDGYTWQNNGKEISDLLLNLNPSIFSLVLTEAGYRRSRNENVFFTEDDIEERYEKEIVDREKNSSLFFRQNLFF